MSDIVYEVKICFLANLQILVAPVASADSIPNPITTSEPLCSSSVFLQVPLNSETTHMEEVQTNKQSEPESLASGSDFLFFDSEPTCVGYKQRCRDISGLSLCLYGEQVQPEDIGSIQC